MTNTLMDKRDSFLMLSRKSSDSRLQSHKCKVSGIFQISRHVFRPKIGFSLDEAIPLYPSVRFSSLWFSRMHNRVVQSASTASSMRVLNSLDSRHLYSLIFKLVTGSAVFK